MISASIAVGPLACWLAGLACSFPPPRHACLLAGRVSASPLVLAALPRSARTRTIRKTDRRPVVRVLTPLDESGSLSIFCPLGAAGAEEAVAPSPPAGGRIYRRYHRRYHRWYRPGAGLARRGARGNSDATTVVLRNIRQRMPGDAWKLNGGRKPPSRRPAASPGTSIQSHRSTAPSDAMSKKVQDSGTMVTCACLSGIVRDNRKGRRMMPATLRD